MSQQLDRAVIDAIRDVFNNLTGVDATADLDAFGIADLIREDRASAVQHVFYEQGRAGVVSNAFNMVQQSILDDHVPGLVGTVALTTGGERAAPVVSFGGGAVSGQVYAFGTPTRLVCYGQGSATTCVSVVDISSAGVDVADVHGIDDTGAISRVDLSHASAEVVSLDNSSRLWWGDAVAWGRMALAWELVGIATATLNSATEYALARVQFGRPIGTFQAVQHRLAETRVAIEAARAILELPESWAEPLVASTAKALAGQAYKVAVKNCLQVFGGIGFTTEHPFDRYLRRGAVLERLLGSSHATTQSIGQHLLQTQTVTSMCTLTGAASATNWEC